MCCIDPDALFLNLAIKKKSIQLCEPNRPASGLENLCRVRVPAVPDESPPGVVFLGKSKKHGTIQNRFPILVGFLNVYYH